MYGIQCIPERWCKVQDYDYLLGISRHLLAMSEDSSLDSKTAVAIPIAKSLDSIEIDDFGEGDAVFCKALGSGIVRKVHRQNTLIAGKYNLLLHVTFESTQTCIFNKLFDLSSQDVGHPDPADPEVSGELSLA